MLKKIEYVVNRFRKELKIIEKPWTPEPKREEEFDEPKDETPENGSAEEGK